MANLFQSDESTTTSGRFAQVAPEQGLERPDGLTYAVPDELDELRVGDRVVVPLGRGNRTVSGYVLSLSDSTELDPAKIKPIAALEREPVNLPDSLIELARWISEYYCCPLGMVLATMLPAAVKHGTGMKSRQLVDMTEAIAAEALPSIVKHHKLPPKQQEVLGKALELAALGKLPMDARTLADVAAIRSVWPVKQLIAKGLLRQVEQSDVVARPADISDQAHTHKLMLTDDQRGVVEQITASLDAGFRVNLLHGVTGSGKTEVYIKAIEPVVAAGKLAVVLVPEISLTPQTVGRFIGRFDRVAVLHSGLTAAQRHQQWLAIRDGWAQVVVGARSAVFAPTDNLGLIIVDEEHDGSYKQDQAPRYHGRDVAIKRAQMHGIPVVLGSATPSLESYYNATRRGTSRLLELPRRVSDWTMPTVEVVDMLEERRQRQHVGDQAMHLLSRRLEAALRQTFEHGAQAMLLLNRRGYASYIACPDQGCGWVMACEHCDVNLVYHKDTRVKSGGVMRCHYCGYENLLPSSCPLCGKKVSVFGVGTQRVEEELARKLPRAKLLRMDSDAMRTGRDYHKALETFRRQEIDLLIGTQMIAKGLDFPNVRLVGVVSADTALHLPDFRAAERTFQLIAQVSGRSGRGENAGRVVVQTFTPEATVIQRAAAHDYAGFAEAELDQRARAHLPPMTRMARVVCRDQDIDKALAAADRLNTVLLEVNERADLGAAVLGPLTPPIARIGGYHRVQIEITASSAGRLQKLLTAARDRGALLSDARMAVDVDPISLL